MNRIDTEKDVVFIQLSRRMISSGINCTYSTIGQISYDDSDDDLNELLWGKGKKPIQSNLGKLQNK